MTLEIVITLLFLLGAIGVILLAEKAKNPIGIVHMLFFVIFMNILHLARLLVNNNLHYDLVYYLITQVVLLIYLGLFALGMLWLKTMRLAPSQGRIFRAAMCISDGWLIAAFSGWLIVKAYLAIKYGVSAFSLFGGLAGGNIVLHFYAWWETPVEFYARAFAVGACGIYVIKAILEKGYWRKHWPTSMAFFTFFAVFISTASSDIGTRRFMLLLVILGLVTIAWRDKKTTSRYLISRWRSVFVVGIVLMGVAGYYQVIRNNFTQPDISDKLLSSNPLTFAEGVGLAMLPVPSSERVSKPAKFLREGPLDIVYDVIQRRGYGNPGTDGEITANAFTTVIPRIIVGKEKKVINADAFLANKMHITPSGPYLVSDVATSLLAIFIADFGYLGALLAPMLILLSLTIFARIPQKGLLAFPPLILFFFSALLHLSANVEGSLVPVLSTFRDAAILILILLPVSLLYASVFRRASGRISKRYSMRNMKDQSL